MKNIFAILLLISFIFYSTISFAQKEETESDEHKQLNTDRPGEGNLSSKTVKPGGMQVEAGYFRERDKRIDSSGSYTYYRTLMPNTLFRFGLRTNWEMRLTLNPTQVHRKYSKQTTKTSGLQPIVVGTKIGLCDEKGIRPRVAVVAQFQLPHIGNKDFQVDYLVPEFRIITTNTLAKFLSMTVNLGSIWGEEKMQAIGIYGVSFDGSFTNKFGGFVEFYGGVPEKDKANHRMDAGLIYLLTNDLQLDIQAGVGLSKSAPDYFVGGGFSWRFVK